MIATIAGLLFTAIMTIVASLTLSFIMWPAPRAGTMKRILCSDWLPERARWAYLAPSGLPALFGQGG